MNTLNTKQSRAKKIEREQEELKEQLQTSVKVEKKLKMLEQDLLKFKVHENDILYECMQYTTRTRVKGR